MNNTNKTHTKEELDKIIHTVKQQFPKNQNIINKNEMNELQQEINLLKRENTNNIGNHRGVNELIGKLDDFLVNLSKIETNKNLSK